MTGAEDVRAAAGFTARPAALAVRCPICHAGEKEPCHLPGRSKRLPKPHPGRLAVTLPCPNCGAAAGEQCKPTGRYDEQPHERPVAAEPTATVLPFQPRADVIPIRRRT